ncbi:MAG TPA: PAS domain S-box protein [Puia sp.]|nr:PAS domain S-box protein [Puia sp.]
MNRISKSDELIEAKKRLFFQSEEMDKRAAELILINRELVFQNKEIERQAAELIVANKKLALQKEQSVKEASDYKYALNESSILAITDQKGIIIHVNANFCKISKYEAAELIGQDHRIINSGFHPKEFMRDMWVTISRGKIWKGQLKNRAKDGTHYWVDTTIVPFLNKEGKPYQYVAIRVDITDHKNAEEKVIQAYKEKEAVLNRISDGVVSFDNDWRYTFINNASLVMHPLGKEKTLGRVLWDVHPEIRGTVFWDKYHEAMLTGNVTEIESYYAPRGVWLFVKVYPSPDGLTIFFKDVTERKKIEMDLAKTLKEVSDYKFALDEANIVAITDQKGVITHVNDNFCRISKYSREELIGQDHRIINSGHHSKEFIRNIWVTIASGKVWRDEIMNKAKDGTVYWVDTTIVPFLDEAGKPYQYVAIRVDITQRKLAEQEVGILNEGLELRVKERTEELESFSYSVSHDLRAPLRAVNGYAQMLREDKDVMLDTESRRIVDNIVNNATRMGQLIDDLLAFSRLGRKEMVMLNIPMKDIVENLCSEIKNEFESRSIQFEIKELSPILGDRVAMKQVWTNLISNAVKFSAFKERPVIEIGSQTEGNEVIYYIKDNGAGFDMRYANKLFGVFQRLHSNVRFEGTGVGLAIVHRIITKHGGKVWAEARVNEGAEFYFSLPINSIS